MDDMQLRLDGNAAAGMLQELFSPEVTAIRGACSVCGKVAEIGAQHLYMYPRAPGAVLRCSNCSNALLVVVHAPGRVRIGAPGCRWMEMEEPPMEART